MTSSLANVYAYAALLQPGDTILRLDLSHGGHLSHGHRGPRSSISEASYRYNIEPYHLKETTGRIDHAELSILSQKLQLRIITIGGSVYCRHLDFLKSDASRMRPKQWSITTCRTSVAKQLQAFFRHRSNIVMW